MILSPFLYGSTIVFAKVLNTAGNFAVLGNSTVTNTGSSTITGDVGVDPGSAITGFPPGTVNGTIYTAGTVTLQAQIDAAAAYNVLAGMSSTGNLTGQNLGSLTLTPGVYTFATSAQLTGPLVLNAENINNAVFDIVIGSTLTTASNSSVTLDNAGLNDSIFWIVGSSATLGTDTSFTGNILADQSVTLTTGADINGGDAIALNGAVTLDDNNIYTGYNGDTPITNPIATPEPATLYLLGLGLGLIGFMKFKRNKIVS